MKKSLLFAAFAAFAMCAQAQVWNFSNYEAITYSENTDLDGFKIYANADYPVTIDSNNKTVDGISYSQRIKTGGSTQVDSVTNEIHTHIYIYIYIYIF